MPEYRTKALPITVEGVTFHCYHTGILRHEWRSEDGLFAAGKRSKLYYARTGEVYDTRKFRTLERAMRAAVCGERRASLSRKE